MSLLPLHELKNFLDQKADQFNRPEFIEADPVSIPHRFQSKEDQEIAGFLAATLSWGNRKTIVRKANRLMEIMGHRPFEFVMEARDHHLQRLDFVHRTFNSEDLRYYILALRRVYAHHGGMEKIFRHHAREDSLGPAITAFRQIFFAADHLPRTEKHLPDPGKGSAAKRMHMMLRWFVRQDDKGVDLGIWRSSLQPSQLSLPLDLHSGTIARKLGLLKRIQNDARAVQEVDQILRSFDSNDPVKYDFALFGLGVESRWNAP